MKRNGYSVPKSPKLPVAWREAEYAMLRTNAADTCDARVSEEIFDAEDERAEVDLILRGGIHAVN
jgi:hypothetical protein